MNYLSFCDTLRKFLVAELPEGSVVEIDQVRKNNGIPIDAIHVTFPGKSCNPLFYPGAIYEAYRSGTSLEEILAVIRNLLMEAPPFPEEVLNSIHNFDEIKDKIVFRLISREKNKDLLEEIPYIPYMDLAIIFFITLELNEKKQTTTLIHRYQMESWKISTKTLFQCARKNTPVLYPLLIKNLEDLVFHTFHSVSELPPLPQDPDENVPLYILTNTKALFGATALLYPEIIKDFAERWGYDLLIIPSSVHEVLVIPDNGCYDYETLNSMIMEVNRDSVEPEDRLSDTLYIYRRAEGSIIPWLPDDSLHTAEPDERSNP